MDRLIIRDGELRGAITSVRASRTEFAHAVSRTDALQQAVGHAGLSGALQGFESRWSVRREKLVTSLEVIEKQLRGVLDTFGEWDRGNTPPQQSPGDGAPQATPTVPTAPGATPAPAAPAPGGSPSTAPAPPSAPEAGAPPVAPDATSEIPQPPEAETPSPDAGSEPDGEVVPGLPGSPEAINDLLDRLERLADTPAGLAALAGSVGALVVLMALFGSGSTVAPGLAGVDGSRVTRLLERYSASTTDPFNGITGTTPPAAAGLDIEQQLDALDTSAGTDGEPATDAEPSDAAEESVKPVDADTPIDDKDGAGVGSGPDIDVDDLENVGSEPAAPQSDLGPGAAGSASLTDLPPPPEDPAAAEARPTVSSDAFDERFPEFSADGGDDLGAAPAASSIDVDAELGALAGGEADPAADGSAAASPRMPMMAGGMGSMAAVSAGHAVTTVQNKGVDTTNDADRLAAVRRELDELRTTSEKEEKS